MSILNSIKLLFFKNKRKDTAGIELHKNPDKFYPAPEASKELERKDTAGIELHKNPDKFHPAFEVSKEPVCPYCNESLGKRKEPTRRSKLSCERCGNIVFVDPWHHIFPSVYLNTKQGLIAKNLGKLDKCPATAGGTRDFWWAAQQKEWTAGKDKLTDAEAGDALWTLMNYNVVNMQNIIPKEEMPALGFYAQELQSWLSSYRDEEKKANAEIKGITKAKEEGKLDSKIDFICPYCNADLGKIPKPSRSSSRKCKKCKEQISIVLDQELFPAIFLTEKQSHLWSILYELERWVVTEGGIKQYEKYRKQMNKPKDANEKDMVEIISAILTDSIDLAWKEAKKDFEMQKKQYEEYKDIFSDTMKPELDDFWPKRIEGLLNNLKKEFQVP